jgi:phosphatidylglycerophosphate synthase
VPDPARAAPGAHFDAVLLVHAGAEQRVGGLRLVERAALTLARAGARRLLYVGSRVATERLPAVPCVWLDAADAAGLAAWAHEAAPVVLVMDAAGVVDAATAGALASAPAPGTLAVDGPPVLWRCAPAALPAVVARVPGRIPDASSWQSAASALVTAARDPAERRAAERALYARLGRAGDGWFTRAVDRRISRALTRLLLPTGVSPNQITLASIAIGVGAGALFATGAHDAAIAGALLFLLSTIVDGCDGEVARLTFRESLFGARLDVVGDNVVHVALFAGIAAGLYRRTADPRIAVLGTLLVVGALLAMVVVYVFFIKGEPTPAQRALFEAVASREFAYLLVILTFAGRLAWFLWLAVIGTYVFVAGLLLLSWRARRAPRALGA